VLLMLLRFLDILLPEAIELELLAPT